jgi:D-alanine-D-alanine ligase
MNSDNSTSAKRAEQISALVRRVMEQGSIAVVHGGDPKSPGAVLHETFNPRGTKSYRVVAEDIANALGRSGFRNVHVVPDGLRLADELLALKADLVWVNSGGVQGYNPSSHTPAMLELMGLPYVGHDPLAASLLDNKHIFKHLMRSLGIPTADFITWNGSGALDFDNLHRVLGADGPYVVKPVTGRASNHVIFIDRLSDVCDAMRDVHALTLNDVLVENYLPGAEYAVAVCGGVRACGGSFTVSDEPSVFSPVQRVLETDERIFTSMDVKPITRARLRIVPQGDPVRDELAHMARAVYDGVNLGALVRLDVRADATGKCCVLEGNPKPDLKALDDDAINIVSLGLPELGMTYDDLILSLLADKLFYYAERRPQAAPDLARFFETKRR